MPDKRRINDYLREKKRLAAQATEAFLPAIRALVGDLCIELGKCRPQTPDAVLIEMFLSDVGIDDEARAACLEIDEYYREHIGLGLLDHHLDVVGHDVIVTLRLEVAGSLRQLVHDTLGEALPLLLRVTLHSAQPGFSAASLVDAENLDLQDLSPLCAAIARYWKQHRRGGALKRRWHDRQAA